MTLFLVTTNEYLGLVKSENKIIMIWATYEMRIFSLLRLSRILKS